MKILSVSKYEKEKLEIKICANNTCMREVVSSEQAEKEKGDIYINDKWHYVIRHDEINFVFLDLESYPLYGVNEQIADILYELDILIDEEVYKIQLSRDEISNEKWLRDIMTQDLLVISRSKYQKLLKEIQPRKGEKVCFESIGVHKIDNQYLYATSNCAVTSKGINREIRALKEGFDLEFDETVREDEYAEKFIRYNMMNLRVFYPIHYMQIFAVLKYFLKEYGISAGAVLWIDGVVAGGKTELAFTVGDMFNRCGDNISMKKNLYTTKIKTKELEKELLEYQNAVLILDDVKKEETVRNRENTKNVTDLVVRSIYLGRLGQAQSKNDMVNASAIITGEFFKEQTSTISRFLYLNIGNFLQESANSAYFKKIQSDKTYFAGFMRYFIQWFFENMEGQKQSLNLERIIRNVSEMSSEESITGKISTRMQELYTNMLVCTQIINKYLEDVLGEDSNNVKKFFKECKKEVRELINETWLKGLNYQPLYNIAFDDVISKLKIKDCRYGENYLRAKDNDISYDIAVLRKDERGISFNEYVTGNKKYWLLRLSRDYAGLLLNLGEEDILIVSQNAVCNYMREYIKKRAKKWHIHYFPSDYTDDKIIGELADAGRIFLHKRGDGTFDRVFNYPLTEDTLSYDSIDTVYLEDIKMVKVNVMHGEENIIDRIEDKEMEELTKWVDIQTIFRNGGYNYRELTTKINNAIEKINKFLDLK